MSNIPNITQKDNSIDSSFADWSEPQPELPDDFQHKICRTRRTGNFRRPNDTDKPNLAANIPTAPNSPPPSPASRRPKGRVAVGGFALPVGGNAPTRKSKGNLVMRSLDEFEEEAIDWLWPHRIPRGMLTLIAGHGDVGKSTILYDIAARISTGAPWPNGEGTAPKGTVLLFNREDTPQHIIKPRIMAAKGNLKLIQFVDGVTGTDGKPRPFNMKDDLEALDEVVGELKDVQMIVFDPLSSYFGGKTDAWKESEVRAALEPLAVWANQRGIAVIGNTHLGKSEKQSNANMRILNSVGISNLARIIYMVAKERDNANLRVMGPTKSNIAKPMPALEFRFDATQVGAKKIEAVRIKWLGTCHADLASVVLGSEAGARPKNSQHERAKAFVREELQSGPMPSSKLFDRGADAGVARATLRRAMQELGVISEKTPGQIVGGWTSRLPETGRPSPSTPQ